MSHVPTGCDVARRDDIEPPRGESASRTERSPTPPACPVCGGRLVEQRAKLICSRCRTICETCCEGGPG